MSVRVNERMSSKGEKKNTKQPVAAAAPAAPAAAAPNNKKSESKQPAKSPEKAAEPQTTTASSTSAAAQGSSSKPTAAAQGSSSKSTAAAAGGSKRNVKPDIAVRDAEFEAISNEFQKIKAERDEVQKKMKDVIEASKGGNDERQKIRAELNKIKDELQKVRAEKDLVLAQQKAASESLEAKYAEERRAKEGLGKFTTVEAIDEEIQRIEKRMTSSNFSAKEEKDMIRDMDKLRLSKKNVGAVKAKAEEVQKAKEARKETEARLNEKKGTVDEVQKRFQNVRDALTALETKDKEGVGAVLPGLRQKHNELNDKLDELMNKRRAVYGDFKDKMKEFYDAENERRRIEQEKRNAEQEKRRLEYEEQQKILEEKRKAKEEQEAKKKPWEEEIALCDFLIGYLQRLSKSSSSSSAAAAAATATAATAASTPTKRTGTDFSGMKPLVRSEDDDYINLGKKAAKPAAAPKPVQKEKSGVLTHSIDTMNSFALLSLIPPSNEAGIEVSITQLKEKRAYYDVLPRAPKKASVPTPETNGEKKATVDAAAAPIVEPLETKKSNKKSHASNLNAPPPSVQDSSLFPHLPGSKPALDANESKQKWGPKPSEGGASSMDQEDEQEEEEVLVGDD